MTVGMAPSLPRSIFIADDLTYWKIAGDPSNVDLLADRDAMIVSYLAEPEVNEVEVTSVRALIDAAGQLSRGALLVRNPYADNSYALADHAIAEFTGAKYRALARVAGLLGATRVDVREVKVEHSKLTWAAGIRAALKGGQGDAEATREVKKKVENSLKGQFTYDGGPTDVVAAQEFLGRRKLTADQQLMDLVELRSGKNTIRRYHMTIDGVREADANFKAAVNLANAGPVKLLGVGAAFSQTVSTLSRIEIEIEITF